MNLKLTNIEKTEELLNYQKWLQDLAANNSDTVVFNDGRDYAAILFNTIFNKSQKEINIFCDSLRPELSESTEYYNALSDCLNRNVKVRVLLTSDDTSVLERPIFQLIGKQNVKILKSSDVNALREGLNNMALHFTVCDGIIYRMEYDVENFKALASFNAPSIGETLTLIFNKTWDAV